MKRTLLVLGAFALALSAAHAQGPLPVLSGTVAIGGAGGWDYVAADPATHLVYVSHGDRMHVVDPAAGKVLAEIPGLPGVHGAAFAPELNRGFITCGKEGTLAVFDLRTSKVLARVRMTGAKPDALAYDPFSRRIFVMNNGGGCLTVVDPGTQAVLGTVALGGAPEASQPDGAGRLFVNLEDRNQVKVVDTRSLKVLATWSLAPHATPTGMAIDVEGKRLFVGCRSGHLVTLDLGTGRILSAIPIGAGVDACSFDPGTHRVFASCKDGTVAVVDAPVQGSCVLAGTLKTEPGSKTMTLDSATHKLYVPAAGAAGTAGDPKAGFQLLEFRQ